MSMNSFHARSQRTGPRPEAKSQRAPEPQVHTGVRADALLVQQGLAASRQAARQLIEAGRVRGPDGLITKPARELPAGTPLSVTTE